MPKKNKNVKIPSLLIPTKYFQKAENAGNTSEFEECLTELINTANERYNEAHQAKQTNIVSPEKFTDCISNYKKIKDIMKISESSLIKIYDLEASLTILQARLNKIDTNPTTSNQLSLIEKEISNIETEFDTLNISINELSANPKDSFLTGSLQKLQGCKDEFSAHWNKNSNRIKADSYYNLAENLIKESYRRGEDPEKCQLLTEIKYHFKRSAELYNTAQLFDYAEQTESRIKQVENSMLDKLSNPSKKKNTSSTPEKISRLVLKKISLSDATNNTGLKTGPATSAIPQAIEPVWQVVTDKKMSLFSTENSVKTNSAKDQTLSNTAKRKRHPLEEHANMTLAKKSKQADPLESLWETENEKIVKQFCQIKIDERIIHALLIEKKFTELRAVACSNYAANIITEDLKNPELPQSKKLTLLTKAKNLLKKSAKYYNQADLSVKKDEIKQYIGCIKSSLKNLDTLNSFSSIAEKKYLVRSNHTVENIVSKDSVACTTRHTNNHFFKQPLEKSAFKDENQLHRHQHASLKQV